jgi:coenzyme F420-reducing hydrogenase delta subunit
VSEIYLFACQHRVPEGWRPPFTPDTINGEKIRLIQLPCSAKLSTAHMLRPFEKGIDGVLVMACRQDGCRSLEGSRRARMRVREANKVLDEVGLGSSRIMMRQEAGKERELYTRAVEELCAEIEKMGPNPIKGKNEK